MRLTPTGVLCIPAIFGLAIALHAQSGGYWVGEDGSVTPAAPTKSSSTPTHQASASVKPAPAPQKPTPPASPAAAPIQRASSQNGSVSWRDPAEGAFTVLLPRGWQISGGTMRTTQIEPHYVIHAQSPDGGVRMFFDDPKVLIGQEPNRMTQMMGWREGSVIPSSWGGKLLLSRYIPGPAFAQQYARSSLCPSASNFQGGLITGQTQELSQQMQPIARAEGKQLRIDVGEVSFQCGSQIGYVYAITLLASQPGQPVQIWAVYRLAGFLASPQDAALAGSAVHTMLGSFQFDQQWLQRFAQQTNDVAGNVIRESNAITQSTMERARQQDAAMDAQIANWKKNSDARFNAIEGTSRAITGSSSAGSNGNGHDYNAQLGQKTVCNDVGTCQKVDASVDNWYSDCSGTFYPGTPSGDPPPASLSACWNKGH